jgi:hypothetical protein
MLAFIHDAASCLVNKHSLSWIITTHRFRGNTTIKIYKYKIKLGRIQRIACLAITGAMKSTPTAAMEVPLNLTPLDLLIMAEARFSLYRLYIPWQATDFKSEVGMLSIWKNVGYSILEMRSDHTTPVSYYSKTFRVIIDQDYWRTKNPEFPEHALIWYTDGSRAESGTGSGICGLRQNNSLSFPLGKFATVFQTEIYAILQCACENIRRANKNNGSLFSLMARLHSGHLIARK